MKHVTRFNTSVTNVDNILDEYGGTHTQMAWSPQERRTVPWLKQLFASLSPWRPGFNPRSVYVGFVVGKVALEQALFTIVSFSCQYYSTNAPHSFTDLLLKIYNLGNLHCH